MFLELCIFYSYILTAIFFLWTAQLFKLNKTIDNHDEHDCLSTKTGDFFEVNIQAQREFSLNTIEITGTVLIWLTENAKSEKFYTTAKSSNVVTMIMLVLYGVVTSFEAAEIFVVLNKWCVRVGFRIISAFRFVLLLIAFVLLFTLQGKEIYFGFWLIFVLCFAVINEIHTYRRYILDLLIYVFHKIKTAIF